MNQTTLSPELEDAIARRNIDLYRDGSLRLANGKPVTRENVDAIAKEESQAIAENNAELAKLRALPADIAPSELRRYLVSDAIVNSLSYHIRQREHQIRESLQFIADMELALAESNNLTKEQTV